MLDPANRHSARRVLAAHVASSRRRWLDRFNFTDTSPAARILITAALLGCLVALVGTVSDVLVSHGQTDDERVAWLASMSRGGFVALMSIAGVMCALGAAVSGFRPPTISGRILSTGSALVGGLAAAAMWGDGGVIAPAVAFAAVVTSAFLAAVAAPVPWLTGGLAGAPWLLAGVLLRLPGEGVATFQLVLTVCFLGAALFGMVLYIQFADAASRRLGGVNYANTWIRTRRLSTIVTWTCLAVVSALWVLRYTAWNDLFGQIDAGNWDARVFSAAPLYAVSWLHALTVAVVVAYAVARSDRRPLSSKGDKAMSTIAMLMATTTTITGAVLGVVLFVFFALGSQSEPAGMLLPIVTASYGVLLLAMAWLARPGAGRTVGAWAARITLLALGPGLFVSAVPALSTGERHWWSSINQQIGAMVLVAAVALVVGYVRGRPLLDDVAARKLILVPIIVIHAGVLLPQALQSALGQVVLVGGVITEFALSIPRRQRGRQRDKSVVLGALSPLVLIGTYTLAVAGQFDLSEDAGALIMLVATLPLSLLVMLTHRPEPAPAGGYFVRSPVNEMDQAG